MAIQQPPKDKTISLIQAAHIYSGTDDLITDRFFLPPSYPLLHYIVG